MYRTLLLLVLAWSNAAVAASVSGGANAAPLVWERTVEYHHRARAAVESVLAAREFGGRITGPTLWQRFVRWLERLVLGIGPIVQRLPSWLFWLLLIWLVLTLIAILAHLLYVIVGLFGARSRLPAGGRPGGTDGHNELLGVRDLEPEAAYERALRLLGQGDWAAATRYLYVAAILWMDRAGQIHYHQAKTNHDYVRELGRHPRRQSGFRQLTRLFETAVYGGRPATETSCREMTATIDALRHDYIDAKG